jgi:hypothetical protein
MTGRTNNSKVGSTETRQFFNMGFLLRIDKPDASFDHKGHYWLVRYRTQCGVDSTYVSRSDLIFALREFDVTSGAGWDADQLQWHYRLGTTSNYDTTPNNIRVTSKGVTGLTS